MCRPIFCDSLTRIITKQLLFSTLFATLNTIFTLISSISFVYLRPPSNTKPIGGGGNRDAEDSEYGEAMGLGMLVRIQVTPRWANDPVCLCNESRQESGKGRVREPP